MGDFWRPNPWEPPLGDIFLRTIFLFSELGTETMGRCAGAGGGGVGEPRTHPLHAQRQESGHPDSGPKHGALRGRQDTASGSNTALYLQGGGC